MTRRDWKHTILGIGALALVLLGICGFCASRAEAANTMTFSPSVSNANGTLQTKLTWSTSPAAQNCAASGNPNWTGTKAVSGSFDLPPITLHGTYPLTLACSWSGDDKATLTWTAPTQNTDGSTLTDLTSFKVYYGTSAAALTQTVPIPGAGTTSYQLTGLTPGTYFFTLVAINSSGVESPQPAPVSKVITGATTDTKSITLTVNPVPAAPVLNLVQ